MPNTHSLPREGVFRLRGDAPTRIESFVDAAFAFAITLLVIGSSGVPTSAHALALAIAHIPNFAVCMSLLWVFWSAHERYSRRFGLEDATSKRLGWLLIFVVLIYVYPLRAVMTLTVNYFTAGAIDSDFHIEHLADLEFAFMIYAAGIIALSAIIAGCNVHALRCKSKLQLDTLEVTATRREIISGLITIQVAATSLAAAIFLWTYPPQSNTWAGIPAYTYMLFAIEWPIFWMYTKRQKEAVGDGIDITFG